MKWRIEMLMAFIFYAIVYFFIGHLIIDFTRLTLPNPPADYVFTIGLWISMFLSQLEFFSIIKDTDNASPFKFVHRKVILIYNLLMLPLVVFYSESFANIYFILRMLATVAYLMTSATLHRYEQKLKSGRWMLWLLIAVLLLATAVYLYM